MVEEASVADKQIILLIQPSSAATEHACFLILFNSSTKKQTHLLQNYIETSLYTLE